MFVPSLCGHNDVLNSQRTNIVLAPVQRLTWRPKRHIWIQSTWTNCNRKQASALYEHCSRVIHGQFHVRCTCQICTYTSHTNTRGLLKCFNVPNIAYWRFVLRAKMFLKLVAHWRSLPPSWTWKKLRVETGLFSVDTEGPAPSRAVVLKRYGPRHCDKCFFQPWQPTLDCLLSLSAKEGKTLTSDGSCAMMWENVVLPADLRTAGKCKYTPIARKMYKKLPNAFFHSIEKLLLLPSSSV